MTSVALNLRMRIGDWLNGFSSMRRSASFSGSLSSKGKILILSEIATEEDKNLVSAAKKRFRDICPRAEVDIVCHCPKDAAGCALISDKGEEYFTDKDLSFFFKIKSQSLRESLASRHDILVLLADDKAHTLNYIAKYANADLRVGRAGTILDKSGVLNFVVESHTDAKEMAPVMASTLAMMFVASDTGKNK